MLFEPDFFQKQSFTPEQIKQFWQNAEKDLAIAQKSDNPEVIFTFAYHALLKVGITLIASKGYKVKSRTGHHVHLLQKLSQLIGDPDIELYGEVMRRKRNADLYLGGSLVTQKEAEEYLRFLKELFKKANAVL